MCAISTHKAMCLVSVIRATVPKLELDDAFVQKDDIAKAVEEELVKVLVHCPVVLEQRDYLD